MERRHASGSACDQRETTTKRGLGPEFIYPFLVLFFATILRKFLRHYHISLPYTVILMLIGAVLGAFYQYELIKRLTFIANLTPVQILAIFLPILIFESAFSCDPHIFIKCLGQILTLAILGFLISVALTTLAVMYWYENEHTTVEKTCWTWDQAVLYSAVVSATDPVSVVSLLKSMTSLKTLSTVIEGESLLNDAAAITVYTLVKNLIQEATKETPPVLPETRATLLGVNAGECAHAGRFLIQTKITAVYLLQFVLKTIAAAVLIGYLMARITILVLYRIEAGELETCLTITMSYFVYLTCEAIEASGVIGVVLLGLTLNMNRACFSVAAIHISEQTWQLLAYVANSLIFITVGVILLKTYSGSDKMLSLLHSVPQLLLIYMIIILVRALTLLTLHYIMKHIAYGFTWQDSVVTIWSGLRGGVSLVLALTLFNSRIKDKYQAETMLIHTTAIVFLTSTVNALTIPNLVHILRMDRTSELIKQTIVQALKELRTKQHEMIRRLKKDPILATADWSFVQKAIDIQSPFAGNPEELIPSENLLSRRYMDQVTCDHCQAHVTVPISKFEFKQTFEDCRIRILRLQKTHFWSDYYNGQLSSYGLHTLNSLCDQAIDTRKQFIDLKTIQAHIVGKSRLRSLLNIVRQYTRQWQEYFPWSYSTTLSHPSDMHLPSGTSTSETVHSVVQFLYSFAISFSIILIECLIVIYQFHTNLCNGMLNRGHSRLFQFHLALEVISLLLFSYDLFQVYGWFQYSQRKRSYPWILLYLIAVIGRLVSCAIYLPMFASRSSCVAFYVFKSVALLECLLLCLYLIILLRFIVDYMLNRYISMSYDLGLAYISSEEQVLQTIHRLTDNESIRIRIRERALQHIKSVLDDVLHMQENHPGTVISIKTHHTLNLLYNTAKRAIARIRARGVLDVDDCDLLEQSLRDMHVHLHIPSTMPPPAAILAIRHLPWLVANDQLTAKDKNDIEQILLRTDETQGSLLHAQSFSWLDYLWHRNEIFQGVYLLVNGLVEEWKLEPYDIDASTSEVRWKETARTRQTTLATQQIVSLQHGKHGHHASENERNTNALSEESVSEEDTDHRSEFQSTDTNKPLLANASSPDDRRLSAQGVRIAFEDGFYIRWHHLTTSPLNDPFKETSSNIDDGLHHSYHVARSEERYDECFDETFEKYRQTHPATSEHLHRRYSFSAKDCIGLATFLLNHGEKHPSTAKCRTNATAFFIAKEKLLHVFNTFSLWDAIWLDVAVQLALRILPDLEPFKASSESVSIEQRLSQAGLLIFHESIFSSDEVMELDDDLLLVTGSLRNQISKCVYEAPIFINHSLSQQGLKLLEGRSMTKLLVLPRDSTVENKAYLFTNRSMVRYILDDYTGRKSHERFPLDERRQTNLNQPSTEPHDQRQIYLRNSIDEGYARTTTDMNRLLLATVPNIYPSSSSSHSVMQSMNRTDRKSTLIANDDRSEHSSATETSLSDYHTSWLSPSIKRTNRD